MKNVNNKR